MFKPTQLLAGAALLLAGSAQADAPEAPATLERPSAFHQEAPAPTADAGEVETTRTVAGKADEAQQELHPDARPVYLNGGYFDGN